MPAEGLSKHDVLGSLRQMCETRHFEITSTRRVHGPCHTRGDCLAKTSQEKQDHLNKMLALSLAFDHRLVHGAPVARFLQRIEELVEQPHLLTAWGRRRACSWGSLDPRGLSGGID